MGPEILAPGIVKIDFPKKIANQLLDTFKKIEPDTWDKADSYMETKPIDGKIRRKSYNLPLHFIDKELNDKVMQTVLFNSNLYKAMYGIKFDNCEGLDVLKYEVGDYFLPHFDGNSNKYRTVSLLIYLNTNEYSGGETRFHNFNLEVDPEEPCMVFFPSNYPYSHSANEIKSGTKYIIVSWFNDLPSGKSNNLNV